MKRLKTPVVIAVVIVLAILLSVAYLLFLSPDKTKAPSRSENRAQTQPRERISSPPAEGTPAAIKGTYIEYSDGIIASTKGEKLLFFHAPWCPQCRAIEADIKDGGVPDNTTIIKVDYDSSQGLRQKYGVTIQTTIIRVDDSGNPLKKFVAYDEPTLASVIKGTR